MKACAFVFAFVTCLLAQSTAAADGPLVVNTNRFHPVPLEGFYSRLLASYGPQEAWGGVPRGLIEFDGVPFRMFGQIELNGLGPSQNRNFLPTRAGEISIRRRATRLHLISGAGYKDPDGTPLAALRLYYANGETRSIFINYGDHVRNWHVESDEKRTDLSHPSSRIVWDGINGATGRPLRLFKNTFENPKPAEEIRSIELFSLFGRAFPIFCAITLETAGGPVQAPPGGEDPDDTPFRRELLVRVVNAGNNQAISNVVLNLTVTEGDRIYGFGRYRSDAHGQILLDYPPARFEVLKMEFTGPGSAAHALSQTNAEGFFPPEIVVRMK